MIRVLFIIIFLLLLDLEFAFCQTQIKLVPSDGKEGDFYGQSVSIFNDFLVVGSPAPDPGGLHKGPGSVYIYKNQNEAWVQHSKLRPTDSLKGDQFGWWVEINDNVMTVTRNIELINDTPASLGSVYVFELRNDNWVQTAKLIPSNRGQSDSFGRAVAIGENVIAVGDPSGTGTVYIFNFQGGTWVETAIIDASDSFDGDFFGGSLDIENELLIVGHKVGIVKLLVPHMFSNLMEAIGLRFRN